jgi:hypothetical protein
MMVHQAVTVMALLGAHKQKGESLFNLQRSCCSKRVLCILHSLPAIFSIFAEKNIFSKVRALEMLHSMRLRVYTLLVLRSITLNASKKCFGYEVDNLITSILRAVIPTIRTFDFSFKSVRCYTELILSII